LKRTGLNIEQIEFLLDLNSEVREDLENKYPNKRMVRWYVCGLKEEYMRLLFRLPEGVRNIDIDCVEIRDEKGIVAFIEFKRGLLRAPKDTPPYIHQGPIATYAELKAMRQLEEATKIPCFVLRFNDKFKRFQIFRITNEKHSYQRLTLDEVWEWRRNLIEPTTLPEEEEINTINLADFFPIKEAKQ